MKTETKITIKTQADFNALPESFQALTEIHIQTADEKWVSLNRTITNARFVAWGSSHVEARESSHVVAWGSSHVEAWESSHVEAWESSHVVAWANASIKVHSEDVSIGKLKHFATAICIGVSVAPADKDDSATVLVTPAATYNKDIFLDIYRENKHGNQIYLYKVVQENYTDHFSGLVKYVIGSIVEPEIWNPDENLQCGDGLHLSPTPDLALSYHQGRVLKCLVSPEDFVVYPHDITKVRCRRVLVIEEINQ